MIHCFHRTSSQEVHDKIVEIQRGYDRTWEAFKQALLIEYALDDDMRVTRRSFLDWVTSRNKGLSILDFLREFERKFSQLPHSE